MKKVVLSKAIHSAGMDVLKDKAEVVELSDTSAEGVADALSDADALILRTNIKITRESLAKADRLAVISRTGVGVDNIDVEAATEKGILVCNTPGVNTGSVAEQTVAHIVAAAKRLREMDQAVRAGNWKIRNSYKSVDLAGKTLGLLGVGQIGTAVARMCRTAFGMRVVAFDPYVQSAEGIELVDTKEKVVQQADFVSVHVPYTDKTHHLVNGDLISLMKPGAFLINTARGAIVDEKALVDALNSGAIQGAGLDVFEDEPPKPDNPLFAFDTVLTTPHASALSAECVAKVATTAAQSALDVLEGRTPQFVFNKKDLGL